MTVLSDIEKLVERKPVHHVSFAKLRTILRYNPNTGDWTWRISPRIGIAAGSAAGFRGKDGYLFIGIDGHHYKASRLAFFYMTSRWPAELIDHKDCNPK